MTEFLDVLVGVDSSGSGHAVDWAAREAIARAGKLTICHVLRNPASEPGTPHGIPQSLSDRGQRLLDGIVAGVARTYPRLPVGSVLAYGPTVQVLTELAENADELVVGTSGVGGSYRIRPGMIPTRVAERAWCPVTVVTHERGRGRVVIGVDGSDPGEAAVDYGFHYASRHGLAVQAMHVRPPASLEAESPLDTSALRTLTSVTEPWTAKFPDVEVFPVLVTGRPQAILAEASRGATLVVVGHLGAGARPGNLLGSVSQDLLQHAHCPVTVAH